MTCIAAPVVATVRCFSVGIAIPGVHLPGSTTGGASRPPTDASFTTGPASAGAFPPAPFPADPPSPPDPPGGAIPAAPPEAPAPPDPPLDGVPPDPSGLSVPPAPPMPATNVPPVPFPALLPLWEP